METAQQYKYSELPLTPSSPVSPRHALRLLTIHPSNELTAQISCTLATHTLHPDPPPIYEALSYTWGLDDPVNPILINGFTFNVRKNLLEALQRLRRPDVNRTLWCDAICTNQEDMEERSSSVKFMGSIYTMAMGGVTFIGRLNDAAEKTRAKQERARKFKQKTVTAQVPGYTDPGYRQLYNFLQTEWMSRVWVVQEVALAPKDVPVKIQRGSHVFDMEEVSDAMSCIYLCNVQSNLGYKFPARLGRIWKERLEQSANPNRLFLDVMQTHAMSKSTDPRDKIYGLAGLAHDIEPALDYDPKVTVSEVYTNLSRQWILKYESLAILAHLAATTHDRNPTLPSWVPDWAAWQPNPYLLIPPDPKAQAKDINYLSSLEHFTAAGRFSTVCSPTFSGNTQECIELEGNILDVVVEIGPICSSTTNALQEVLELFGSSELVAGVRKFTFFTMEDEYSREWADEDDLPTTKIVLNAKARYPATGELLLHAYYSAMTMDELAYSHAPHRFDAINRTRRLHKRYSSFDTIIHSLRHENDPRMLKSEWQYVMGSMQVSIDRRLVRTESKKYLGMFCERVQPGDVIVLLKGARVPFALRKKEVDGDSGNEFWEIIGDGYLHGVMKGEAWRDTGCRKFVVS